MKHTFRKPGRAVPFGMNPMIEMIVDFKSSTSIQCAAYIQNKFQNMRVLKAQKEEIYYPWIDFYVEHVSVQGVKIDFYH